MNGNLNRPVLRETWIKILKSYQQLILLKVNFNDSSFA